MSRQGNRNNNRNRSAHTAAAAATGGGGGGGRDYGYDDLPLPPGGVECYICAQPVAAFCVFSCGHSACYSCGLRIHTISKGGCPVCRVMCTAADERSLPIVTRVVSTDEEQYSAGEIAAMRAMAIHDRKLSCVIDGVDLATEVAKLYEYLCPMESCWSRGAQDPFLELAMLKDHMKHDHQLAYCDICLSQRPAFLCEEILYGEDALRQHMSGSCPHDSLSFTGHPPCKFCAASQRGNKLSTASYFYDGEALLKHMQQDHFTCDVCNRGQFTFTFYENRNKLNQHFEQCHKTCDHPACAGLDLMLRVFADEFDLAIHKQRVHGIKAKITFAPGNFSPTSNNAGTGNFGAAGANSSGGGSSSGPATGSNTNVIQITFDHVYRRETVEMLPTKSAAAARQQRGGNSSNRRHGGAGGGSAKSEVHAPEESGLPLYYHRAELLSCLVRPEDAAAAAEKAKQETTSPKGSKATTVNSAGSGGGGSGWSPAPNSGAFGISQSMDDYNHSHHVPHDPREQERRLNEILTRELVSPVAYAHFKGYTREFIDSKLLTSEYYDLLAKEVFPDKAVFKEVFPLLVATVPNAAKKTALQEVWKMKTAPEMQRKDRVEAEEAEERALAAEVARQEQMWRDIKAANAAGAKVGGGGNHTNTNNKGARHAAKQNAWMNPSKMAKLQSTGVGGGGGGGTSPNSSSGGNYGNANNGKKKGGNDESSAFSAYNSSPGKPTNSPPPPRPASSGSLWASSNSGGSPPPQGTAGAAAAGVSSPTGTLGPALESQNLYPTLPSAPVRQSQWAQKKPAAKKANAWFTK